MAKANVRGMLPSGRKKAGPPFTKALHAIHDHPDYVALTKQTRAFLWDLARQYNGYNNGNLAACEGLMRPLGWSKWELMRARSEALEMGWIEVTRYPTAKRDPVLYRLTWMLTDRWEGRPVLDPGATQQKVRSLK